MSDQPESCCDDDCGVCGPPAARARLQAFLDTIVDTEHGAPPVRPR